eukprot:751504-Hanusia_phi.AAC.2
MIAMQSVAVLPGCSNMSTSSYSCCDAIKEQKRFKITKSPTPTIKLIIIGYAKIDVLTVPYSVFEPRELTCNQQCFSHRKDSFDDLEVSDRSGLSTHASLNFPPGDHRQPVRNLNQGQIRMIDRTVPGRRMTHQGPRGSRRRVAAGPARRTHTLGPPAGPVRAG